MVVDKKKGGRFTTPPVTLKFLCHDVFTQLQN